MGTSKIFLGLLIFLFSGCLSDDPLKLKYQGFEPKDLDDGLLVALPEHEGVDQEILKKAFDLFYSNEFPFSKGLVVIKNGKLIAEAYAQGDEDIKKIDNIQSCTKSLTSILVGIALEEGLIKSFQDPIYNYLSEYFDENLDKRKISIRNCLTLEAGLDYQGGKDSEKMVNFKGSSIQYVLEKQMVADTGSEFSYSDFPHQLLTGVLNKVTPNGVSEFAKSRLFQPLGVKNFKWETTNDGLNIGGFSLFLTTRDLAKIGNLCVQNGFWNNKSLVDSIWIKEMSRKQAKSSDYGYGFFVNQSDSSFLMSGNGGQFVYMLPSKNLVIAYTANPYTSHGLWGDRNELINIISSSCK